MPRIQYRNSKGTIIPGVTTVISGNLGWATQGLMYWAWKQGTEGKHFRDVADAAAQVGTIAHKMVECDLRGIELDLGIFPPDLAEQAMVAFSAWLEWKEHVNFELISAETSLISEKLQIGGTFDAAMIKRVRSIMDIKTTNEIRESHIIQNCVYGHIWNENFPDTPIEAYYLLKLGKTGPSFGYHYWGTDHPVVADSLTAFKSLRRLHCLKKRIKV